MFGLLKNKLAGFINGLTGREEKKEPSPAPEARKEEPIPEPAEKPIPAEKKAEPKKAAKEAEPKQAIKEAEQKPVAKEEAKPAPHPHKKEENAPEETKEAGPRAVEEKAAAVEQKKSILDSILGHKPAEKKVEPPTAQKKEAAQITHQKTEVQEKAVAPAVKERSVPQKEPAEPVAPKEVPEAKEVPKAPESKAQPPKEVLKPAVAQQDVAVQQEHDLSRLGRKAADGRKDMAPKIGIGTTIRSLFSSEVTIAEADVSDLIEELELSLLEADVEYGVSMEVASQLRGRLVGMKVPKGRVAEKTKETIAQVLESIMDSGRKFDFLERVQGLQKPAKILFVGPNGAGKTTTMAKVARMLSEAGITSVFSASDTFRAAAIEQTEVHGSRLGIKVIKSRYGADPASVAFDAVNFASSHGIGAVLIDSAGRQDTNANLLSELKKINRVAKPDIKIYVGESIGGNALIDQVKAFDEAIGIDGAILTKLDCDAKGGTAISISKATGIPVLFLGVGQRYEDLVRFDPHKIAQEIMT